MTPAQSQPPERTLVVVRHAKAEPHATTDSGRPLTATGLQQARDAARWLGEELAGSTPDDTTALVSSAVRARQTWDVLTHDLPATVRVLAGLYGAGVAEVLTTVAMVEPDVRTVVLVGHNPTMQDLILHLAGDGADQDADHNAGDLGDRLRSWGLTTGMAVVMDVRSPWRELEQGCGFLRSMHRPAVEVSPTRQPPPLRG